MNHSPVACSGPAWARAFTLIEVLVALAIVSVALIAALRAAAGGTNNVNELRGRLLAGWVAENIMAEHHAMRHWPPLGIQRGAAVQGGQRFTWREEIVGTPNQAFRRVDIFVFSGAEESRPLAQLTGFIVQAPAP